MEEEEEMEEEEAEEEGLKRSKSHLIFGIFIMTNNYSRVGIIYNCIIVSYCKCNHKCWCHLANVL